VVQPDSRISWVNVAKALVPLFSKRVRRLGALFLVLDHGRTLWSLLREIWFGIGSVDHIVEAAQVEFPSAVSLELDGGIPDQ
jgi:hypothetical protein